MTFVEFRQLLSFRYIPTWIGLGIVRLLSLLPLRALWIAGGLLGVFAWLFPSKLKSVAQKNIELCFPAMSPEERRHLVYRHFRVLGFTVLCMGLSWWASPRRLRRIVRLVDAHYVEDAMAEGKRIILFGPHFLGLDVCGFRMSVEWKMVSMYRSQRNKVLERMLQKRGRFGGIVFDWKANLKPLIRHIREGRPFYYLPDQDPGGAEAVFVPFFGVPAATVTAFSRIAKMTDAVVIPCYNRILPHGAGFEIRFYPPLAGYPSDNAMADAARMNKEIEKEVLQRPEQYLWVYRRFKTRPPGSPPLY